MIRLGLLGFGRIARLKHFPILKNHPDARLTAVAEMDEGQRNRFSGDKYADYRELLASADVDAVVLALPTHLHAAAAIAAFEAGKHVYIEKPVAISHDEADRLRAAWREANTVGMSGFNFRYLPHYQQMREAVAASKIGDVLLGQAIFTNTARSLPHWKRTRASGGGALLDLASHLIDLARFVLEDEVAQVFAQTQTYYTEQDNATLTLTMRGGTTLQLLVSMSGAEVHRFELTGTEGRLLVDRFDEPELVVQGRGFGRAKLPRLKRTLRPSQLLHTPDYNTPFANALNQFIQAANGKAIAYPNVEDGIRSLEVVLAAEHSAETGQPVIL